MFSLLPINNSICAPKGFFCDGLSIGLKPNNKPDLAFIYSSCACEIEALFTQNAFQAAPILHFKHYPQPFKTNFVLINSKNANALTGKEGVENIHQIMTKLSQIHPSLLNPLMSSTGVIGVPLPTEKIIQALPKIDLNKQNSNLAAEAIMTTDSFPKSIAFEVKYKEGSFKIGAICKGAGMINPSLATMLCFITTDAAIPKCDMKAMLQQAAYNTFNAISVDGDTSTNDTIFLLSNAQSNHYHKEAFAFALQKIMHSLALDIVKDGEGASKLVAFEVKGAKNQKEAEICAKALSQSLLVKTALFGGDPNWGRIASTIGASQITCDAMKLSIAFDEVCVYSQGRICFDAKQEAKAAEILQRDCFVISCDLGLGDGSFRAYGCDLGHEYVNINASYRS